MIVSILQRMGFPLGKPVHSRAVETPPGKPVKAHGGVAAVTEQAQDSSARRQDVKSKSGNDIKAKDAKSTKMAVEQSKAKAVAKPVTPVKTVVKPAVKTPVKTVAVKVATPPAAKPASKAAATPAAKAAVPAKASKPVAKAPAKVGPVAAKAATKVASKPAAKVAAPAKAAATKSASKPPVKSASVAAVSKAKASVQESQSVAKAASASVTSSAPTVVAKAGRPSSRLAQLTVPSMAQSVASTAAKASYSQTMPTDSIIPVLPAVIKKDAKLANNWKTTPVAELTDAELLAMPDSEYMNEVQLAAFRLKLSQLKRDILSNAGETTEHLREDTSVVPDPADRATIEEEHALELRTRDRERKLLKKIEQSIARIDAGDYGYCDETGESIGVGRLLARPTATLSLEAQQRRELKQKMFGD